MSNKYAHELYHIAQRQGSKEGGLPENNKKAEELLGKGLSDLLKKNNHSTDNNSDFEARRVERQIANEAAKCGVKMPRKEYYFSDKVPGLDPLDPVEYN